jgi:peptidoglycan hydrolase FlgJ
MSTQLDSAFVYNDLSGLNSIKEASRGENSDEALRAVAQQFESMYMNIIMKSMSDANKSLNPDSMFNSNESESWQDMHRQQTSLSMSQDGGMGLADVLFEQMKGQERAKNNDHSSMNLKTLAESERSIVAARQANTEKSEDPLSFVNQWLKDAPFTSDRSKTEFDTPQDFIKSLYPHAENAAKALGLEPKFLLAQAALETGWGQNMINDKNGASFNIFGIKADPSWQGDATKVTTHEFMQGKKVKIQDQFRSYDNWQQGFNDYVDFIKSNPRYQDAVANVSDAKAYFAELQKAGYATDPEYADKINRVANSSIMKMSLSSVPAHLDKREG